MALKNILIINCPSFCTELTTVVAVVMNSLVFREIATFSCRQKYPEMVE